MRKSVGVLPMTLFLFCVSSYLIFTCAPHPQQIIRKKEARLIRFCFDASTLMHVMVCRE